MFVTLPSDSYDQGSPASAPLFSALRTSDRYLDNAAAALASQLDSTDGHSHDGTREAVSIHYIAAYVDIFSSGDRQNNRVDFRYGGGAHVAADYTASLSAAAGPSAHDIEGACAALQTAMRAAVAAGLGISASAVKIAVFYVDPSDPVYATSPTPGRVVVQHTGTTDSTETRVLRLYWASGANAATNCGPALGFTRGYDCIGGLSYAGDSGHFHGYEEDRFTLPDGGKLGSGAFASNSVTAGKLGGGVVTSAKFGSKVVTTAKIATGAAYGKKLSPTDEEVDISSGGSYPFTITTSDGRKPLYSITTRNSAGAPPGYVYVSGESHVGSTWTITVTNAWSATQTVVCSRL